MMNQQIHLRWIEVVQLGIHEGFVPSFCAHRYLRRYSRCIKKQQQGIVGKQKLLVSYFHQICLNWKQPINIHLEDGYLSWIWLRGTVRTTCTPSFEVFISIFNINQLIIWKHSWGLDYILSHNGSWLNFYDPKPFSRWTFNFRWSRECMDSIWKGISWVSVVEWLGSKGVE